MNKTRRCFTLIEVLIAIALILALVGTMYGFLFDILSSRSRALGHIWQETAASALIKQLESDLATSLVGDPKAGSGVKGDETHIAILSRSVAASQAGRGIDEPEVFSDLQRAEYRFDAANLRIEGRRKAIARFDAPLPNFTPIDGPIYKLRFRYHDGTGWRRSFDSLASNRLPLAVEVAIWCRPHPSDPQAEQFIEPSESNDVAVVSSDSFQNETQPDLTSPEETSDEPPADRLRVITIPDAGQVKNRDVESLPIEQESAP